MIWVFRCYMGTQPCCCCPLATIIITLSLKFIHIDLHCLQRLGFKSHLPWPISSWESAAPSPYKEPMALGAARAPTPSHLVSARGPPGHRLAEGQLPQTNGDLCHLGHQLFQHLATGFLVRADIWLLLTKDPWGRAKNGLDLKFLYATSLIYICVYIYIFPK